MLTQREAAEGESRNTAEAKKRVAENETSANIAEAAFRAEDHVNVSASSLLSKKQSPPPPPPQRPILLRARTIDARLLASARWRGRRFY